MEDLLSLLNVVVLNCVPTSKYFLERYFLKSKSSTETHIYCPDCNSYLGILNQEYFSCSCQEENQTICAKECFDNGNYFLVSPLKDQLKHFMEQRNLFDMIQKGRRDAKTENHHTFGDIVTGRRHTSRGDKINSFLSLSPFNFTMSFSTDGISVFDSSNMCL